MGLDLFERNDETLHCRVGSYGSVHEIRSLVADMVSRPFFYKQFDLKGDEEVIQILANFAAAQLYSELDFFRRHEEFLNLPKVYQGVIEFVDHSDCDGYHLPNEVSNITELFLHVSNDKNIEKFKEETKEEVMHDYKYVINRLKALYDFFYEVDQVKGTVLYG